MNANGRVVCRVWIFMTHGLISARLWPHGDFRARIPGWLPCLRPENSSRPRDRNSGSPTLQAAIYRRRPIVAPVGQRAPGSVITGVPPGSGFLTWSSRAREGLEAHAQLDGQVSALSRRARSHRGSKAPQPGRGGKIIQSLGEGTPHPSFTHLIS